MTQKKNQPHSRLVAAANNIKGNAASNKSFDKILYCIVYIDESRINHNRRALIYTTQSSSSSPYKHIYTWVFNKGSITHIIRGAASKQRRVPRDNGGGALALSTAPFGWYRRVNNVIFFCIYKAHQTRVKFI